MDEGPDSSHRQVPEASLEVLAMVSTTSGTGLGEPVGKAQASALNGWASVFPSVKGRLEPIREYGLGKLKFWKALAESSDRSFRIQIVSICHLAHV